MLNSRHFEFQISSSQRKFLDFLQKHFFHSNFFFKMIFFLWMGGAGPRKRGRACPPSTEKYSFWKMISMKNLFLQKVKKFTSGLADLKFEMSRIQEKSRNLNFGFVQIGSSLNFILKMKSLFFLRLLKFEFLQRYQMMETWI